MTYETEKARLYSKMEQLTGIKRKIDPRLEKIADDRALEARFQVGTTGSTPISHPVDQLKARTWPMQGTYKGVWENATWHYYPSTWVDPIDAMVDGTLPSGSKVGWWNSAAHKTNMMNPDATSWGLGIHVEPVPNMASRHYAITIFTKDLKMDVIVTTGVNFPDALSVGPLAARLNAPILLVGQDSVPTAVKTYLAALNPNRILVIGGPSAVSAGVVATLATYAMVERIAGTSRYDTAVKVAQFNG